jgi:exosortase A-associated hydrolase 2
VIIKQPSPLLIDRSLFAVLYEPAAPAGEAVLALPPFGEEMNRSRPMMARLGRALAARGIALLVLDPFGTGDSAGNFAEASWPRWRADALRAARWLSERFWRVVPLGLRTGGLLAAATSAALNLDRTILWQPVLRGEQFLTQMLRIRAAASLHAERESVTFLRQRLAAGETLEVGGYVITAAMAAGLDTLTLEDEAAQRSEIVWFQLAESGGLPPAAVTSLCESWRQRDVRVHLQTLSGPPFWSIEEPTLIASLIEATCDLWQHERDMAWTPNSR